MKFYENVGEYTEAEKRLMSLCNMCTEIQVFQVEGRMFLGNYVGAVKQFIKNNPQPADFYVWLQDNYKEVKQ